MGKNWGKVKKKSAHAIKRCKVALFSQSLSGIDNATTQSSLSKKMLLMSSKSMSGSRFEIKKIMIFFHKPSQPCDLAFLLFTQPPSLHFFLFLLTFLMRLNVWNGICKRGEEAGLHFLHDAFGNFCHNVKVPN